jgi:hypothetical protein
MAKIKAYPINNGHITFMFYCPACKTVHALNDTWKFNNDFDNPTFSPSIKVTGHDKTICHSHIKNGKIIFCNDCTHELKSQTINLPEYTED